MSWIHRSSHPCSAGELVYIVKVVMVPSEIVITRPASISPQVHSCSGRVPTQETGFSWYS